MKKTLAIVILTWNDHKNTIKCLKSIINQLKKDKKIFLVDNNSSEKFFNNFPVVLILSHSSINK